MHCKEAPCVDACPTGASQKREDGIVWVDQNKCVGCRYCVIVCPYQNRTFVSKIKEFFPGLGLTEYEKIGQRIYPHEGGVTEKCNFCMERVDAGLAQGLKPGVDRDATPVSVNCCQAKAVTFGDLDDPNSEVSTLVRKRMGTQLHPEFGTDPSIFFVTSSPRMEG
jgi:phenylacetyl-CoA:acceptor oxidoreductase subunit 1